ncbi:MAG: hypothetical protein L0206_13830 [Actinobacteria bacterium]|nr:hypothetical protein [Actinomycetota bacterium]
MPLARLLLGRELLLGLGLLLWLGLLLGRGLLLGLGAMRRGEVDPDPLGQPHEQVAQGLHDRQHLGAVHLEAVDHGERAGDLEPPVVPEQGEPRRHAVVHERAREHLVVAPDGERPAESPLVEPDAIHRHRPAQPRDEGLGFGDQYRAHRLDRSDRAHELPSVVARSLDRAGEGELLDLLAPPGTHEHALETGIGAAREQGEREREDAGSVALLGPHAEDARLTHGALGLHSGAQPDDHDPRDPQHRRQDEHGRGHLQHQRHKDRCREDRYDAQPGLHGPNIGTTPVGT